MKIENISNDMICSIGNTNEFFESTQSVDSRQFQYTVYATNCKVKGKATATTANHSKSNYGIYFSYMFQLIYERHKVPEIIVFFFLFWRKKFPFTFSFFFICTTCIACLSCDIVYVLTLYRRRSQHPILIHLYVILARDKTRQDTPSHV